jgi:hypothetical protein
MGEPELKIVDGFICKLRKKLDTSAGGRTTSRPYGAAVRSWASRFSSGARHFCGERRPWRLQVVNVALTGDP